LKPKIFVVNTLYFRLLTLPLALIPYIVGLYHSIRFYSGDALDGLIGSVGFFVVTTAAAMFISSPKKNPFLKLFVGAIWVAVMWVVIKLFGDAISYQGTFYWVVLAACVVANMIQMIFYRIIDKRTEYGIDLLGRIRGFRRYLIEASPQHLESRIEDDPEYYYKILPYTYVLGVTDAWIKNFESIAVVPPKWFKGFRSSVFDFRHFNRFMSRTMYSAERSMTSTPSSSSSGGGHSGGGGGGGGGGSW
ncbi:MAG: DUF2207 domain-containing protein, partial [Eubacterium sp.]|nr:DUF2207 domain-containing protein [Eubacterium sp.]